MLSKNLASDEPFAWTKFATCALKEQTRHAGIALHDFTHVLAGYGLDFFLPTLIKGEYKTSTWNHFTGEDGRLFCGIWESTKGKINFETTEWEYCYLLAGEVVLKREDGAKWRLKKGDGFIIPAGFKGTWETVRKVKKHYVILMPKSAAK